MNLETAPDKLNLEDNTSSSSGGDNQQIIEPVVEFDSSFNRVDFYPTWLLGHAG